ncbi:MAG TPA: dipeptidase [Anaerolineae bacterium]|nr:dipeptidase [Anaerolineae bacterium]
MSNPQEAAIQYLHANHDKFVEELTEFSKIPSISTDPKYKEDMKKTADWVANQFRELHFSNVKIFPTDGHPVVYGEYLNAGKQAPTALIYGHYDVQPAEPIDKWDSPPFEPVVRGENIYARGVTDMKGQVLATIKAVKAIIKTGDMPVNVKFMIEGEEEIGSPNLAKFIKDHKDMLACDFALNPDTGMIAPNVPTITYALRGLAYFELKIYGPALDLHSGVYGGVVHNPAQALAELIAGMHDNNGKVTLPGFYDSVRPLDPEEREELSRSPMDENFYLERTGVKKLWGEKEYTPVERTGARPTLEINGMFSGFIGKGSKTVLPAFAMAKISCRLVPDQHPDEVHNQLIAYLKQNAPDTIRWEVSVLTGGEPSLSNRNSKWVKAYLKAAETSWGTRPIFKREGGSVPVVSDFQKILNVDSVNIGFATPDDNMHGPNEKLHLPTWFHGMDALVHFFYNLSE